VAERPTPEQHRALLNDCRAIARALPTSGVLDRGRRPYRPIRFEPKLDSVANDPPGLVEYVRGMAGRTSEGLESLVEYNRLDLSVELLILDESKPYASLFTDNDRVAARAKLQRQAGQIEDLARSREQQRRDADAEREKRIAAVSARLPAQLEQLRSEAAQATEPEVIIATTRAILRHRERAVVALNRLGRAYQEVGSIDDARAAFSRLLEIDPENTIATRRMQQLQGRSDQPHIAMEQRRPHAERGRSPAWPPIVRAPARGATASRRGDRADLRCPDDESARRRLACFPHPSRARRGDSEMRGAARDQVGYAETTACVENAPAVALRDTPNHGLVVVRSCSRLRAPAV
jgi:tetratricopeptide (TPR) repeat protein